MSILFSSEMNCWLFSAMVTKQYDPLSSPLSHNQNNNRTYGQACFSSYNYLNDITSGIIKGKAKTIHSIYLPVMAYNGISTQGNHQVYHSDRSNQNWLELEFKNIVTITEVVLKTRSHHHSHFANVQYRVSNKTEDVTTPVLFYYNAYAGRGSVIKAKFSSPGVGRFLHLRTTRNNEYLIIGNMIVNGFM